MPTDGKMRSLFGLLLVLLCLAGLSGCERTPLERLVYEHARDQAQVNAANFERNKGARERQQLALRRQFGSDDEGD
jgi:hypothetical protein